MAATKHNLISIIDTIKTEEDAASFFSAKGVIHSTRKCPIGHIMKRKLHHGGMYWRCSRKLCSVSLSVRKDTWLEGTTIPLRKIIVFIYSWIKQFATVEFCDKDLGLSRSTVIKYNNLVLEACAEDLLSNPIKVGGPEKIVDVHEAVFSRPKFNKGRSLPRQCVFGGICRETKQVFLFAAPCLNRDTLEECIKQCVLPGTTIYSHLWKKYSHIPQIEGYSFRHRTVNPRSTIDSQLCEFMWRKRHEKCDPFEKFLECIAKYVDSC